MKTNNSNTRPIGGFSLIEIMVVLGILMLMVGLGTKGVGLYNDANKLQNAADVIKASAKTCWRRSVGRQQSWQMVFNGKTVELQLKQPMKEEEKTSAKEPDELTKPGEFPDKMVFDNDLTFRMKHFGEVQWQAPKPDRWIFEANGICEPITIRIDRDNRVNGKQEWVEMSFDPLTAGVQNIEFSE